MKKMFLLFISIIFNIAMLLTLFMGIIAGIAENVPRCVIYMIGSVICQIFFLFFLLGLGLDKRFSKIETNLKELPEK